MPENTLPISIVVIPPSQGEVTTAVKRTFQSIEAAAEKDGRKIGQKAGKGMAKGISSAKSQIEKAWKQHSAAKTAINRAALAREKMFNAQELAAEKLKNRQIETDWKRHNVWKASQGRKQLNQLTNIAKASIALEKQKQAELRKTAQVAARTASAKEGIFAAAGVAGPSKIHQQLRQQQRAQALLNREIRRGNITAKKATIIQRNLTKRMNLLTKGTSNARSGFRRLTARMASFSFELTGAIFGLTAVAGILAGPAFFGGKFLKNLEDAQLGMSGILISMGQIDGRGIGLNEALAVSDGVMQKLTKDSLKFAVSLEAITETFQATLAPGLAQGLNLDEIREIATIGTVAVKAIGLDSRQTVQEIRDLVAGGIQAASSTLARSLGLTDADINKAVRSTEGLFKFLRRKLDGFAAVAQEREKTLSGAFDILSIKVQRLFADPALFEGLKIAVIAISNSIATIDKQTQEIKFNEGLVDAVKDYLSVLTMIVKVLKIILVTTIEYSGWIVRLIKAFAILKIAKIALGFRALAAATTAAAKATGIFGTLMISTSTKLKNLKTFALTFGKGGLLGFILFGVFVAADYFGVIDTIIEKVKRGIDALAGTNTVLAEKTASFIETLANKSEDELNNMLLSEKLIIGLIKKNRDTLQGREEELTSPSLSRRTFEAVIPGLSTARGTNIALNAVRLREANEKLDESESRIKGIKVVLLQFGSEEVDVRGKSALGIFTEIIELGESDLEKATRNLTLLQGKFKGAIEEITSDIAANRQRLTQLLSEQALLPSDGKSSIFGSVEELNKLSRSVGDLLPTIDPDAAAEIASLFSKIATAITQSEKATGRFDAAQDKTFGPKGQNMVDGLTKSIRGLKNELLALRGLEPERISKVDEIEKQIKEGKITGKFVAPARREALEFELATKKLKVAKEAKEFQDLLLSSQNSAAEQRKQFSLEDEQRRIAGLRLSEQEIEKLQLDITKRGELVSNAREMAEALSSGTAKTIEDQQKIINIHQTKAALIETNHARQIQIIDAEIEASNKWQTGADDALRSYEDSIGTAAENSEALFTKAFKGMEDALVEFANTGKLSFADLAKSIINDMIRMAAKSAALNIGKLLLSGVGGEGGGLGGFFSSFLGSVSKNAQGNVFSGPGISAFSNSIVASPTVFPFAKGIGLMGEAGAEAILPLSRTPSGNLGVETSGGGGSSTTLIVNTEVNIDSNGNAQVSSTADATAQGKVIANMVEGLITSRLLEEQRTGGLLNRR